MDLLFRHFATDQGAFVAVQVAEARVAQDIGRFPGGKVQPAPHLYHPCRRAEPGLLRIFPPERLSRLAAGTAQLVGGEALSGGVASQLFG